MDFFDRIGLEVVFRWLHVLVGITWIGLLYYFNFVQGKAFAELDANARSQATDKLASRALWWFRWAAAATFVMGLLILGTQEDLPSTKIGETAETGFSTDYWGTIQGTSILTGALFGTTMFLNVWLLIWPAQKRIIANARNVLAGGEADPGVAALARPAFLASRANVFFSVVMLWFMVSTSFVARFGYTTDDGILVYWIVVLVVWAVLEAYATGMIGGLAVGGHRAWEETTAGVIISSFVLWGIFILIWQLLLRA